LDHFVPGRLWRDWHPVAAWLTDVGTLLEHAQGEWYEIVPFVPAGVEARTKGGIRFIFGLRTEFDDHAAILLLVDWRTFNRCTDGPEQIAQLIGTVTLAVGGLDGAAGPASMWRLGVSAGISSASSFGAILATGPEPVPGFGDRPVSVGSVRCGWRAMGAAETAAREADNLTQLDTGPATAKWTGCSGKFADTVSNVDEASLHYEKHVRLQREWSTDEMPSVAAYVATATRVLDAVDDTFEFWQPANHSVIKYDPADDTLGIADLHSGDIRTCFRPGGADYTLRKLRSGQWMPPPILGSVALLTRVDDDELEVLFTQLETAIAESAAAGHAAVVDDYASNLLSAVASHERCLYLLSRVLSSYLTHTDEVRLDAVQLKLAEATAPIDLALECARTDALIAAVERDIRLYLRDAPIAAVGASRDDLDDILILRDRIEFLRMATRARGPRANLLPVSVFRGVEVAATDAFVALCGNAGKSIPPSESYPETFVWRQARQHRVGGEAGSEREAES
jgi:hypothetical protein